MSTLNRSIYKSCFIPAIYWKRPCSFRALLFYLFFVCETEWREREAAEEEEAMYWFIDYSSLDYSN